MANSKYTGKLFIPTVADRAVVRALAGAAGMSHRLICLQIIDPATDCSIDAKTLRKHFKDELREGKEGANAAVRLSLFQMATTGKQVAAAIFWAKTQMGYKEPAQDVNVNMTYGELVQAAAKSREQAAAPPALSLVSGGKPGA